MGLFNIFKKKERSDIKCAQCFKIVGKTKYWKIDGKQYCQDCYNKKITLMNQRGGNLSEYSGFEMPVDDVFSIKNVGVALTGTVRCGCVSVNDTVVINDKEYTVVRIDMLEKGTITHAKAGDNIGLMIRALDAHLFKNGDIVFASQKASEAKTFVCQKCKRELDIKYLHKTNTCAECFSEDNNDHSETANQAIQKDDILHEQFQGFAPVNGDRNKEICDKFIAKGIGEYSNNTFDENELEELTFDEFCHIYSTIGWFVEKIAPGLKENAISYKKFLRKKLLSKLSTASVYTIYATVNNLPFVAQDGSLLLYSNKIMAEMTVRNSNLDWLEVYEITPELFNTAFCEYFCTGYQSVNINGQTKVKIEDVYDTKSIDAYGNICIEACTRMVDYKQTQAMIISRAKKENRNLNEDEIKQLNQQSYTVSVSLLKNALILPAEFENGMPKKISVPLVSFEDGRKFIGLFTDQWAINGYYKKYVSCVAFPDLIRDQYNQCKDDANVSGILINPGREEYMMTKEMLSQLFANA